MQRFIVDVKIYSGFCLPIRRSHISIDDYQFAQILNRTSTLRPDRDSMRWSLPQETCVYRKKPTTEIYCNLYCRYSKSMCCIALHSIIMFNWMKNFMHSLSINKFFAQRARFSTKWAYRSGNRISVDRHFASSKPTRSLFVQI